MMKIVLNGEPYSVEEGSCLDKLLRTLQLEQRRIAVEVNQEIVPRSQYGQYQIQSEDAIEIVAAIGGG